MCDFHNTVSKSECKSISMKLSRHSSNKRILSIYLGKRYWKQGKHNPSLSGGRWGSPTPTHEEEGVRSMQPEGQLSQKKRGQEEFLEEVRSGPNPEGKLGVNLGNRERENSVEKGQRPDQRTKGRSG